jgi:hypothetical protein
MNYEQITGILKILVPTILAILAPIGFSGLSDPATMGAITTAVVAIGASLWSYFAHTNAAKLKAAAAVDPKIQIVVPPSVQAASPDIAAVVADHTVPNVTSKI